MEPITTLTASTIAGLAFNEFIKSGSGEIAKKSVGSAIDLVKNLRDNIQLKFQGDKQAETALTEFEQQGKQEALNKITTYLNNKMNEDKLFDTEVRQIAQQIINIQNQNNSNRKYNNYGRDQFNIEKMEGSQRLGG